MEVFSKLEKRSKILYEVGKGILNYNNKKKSLLSRPFIHRFIRQCGLC